MIRKIRYIQWTLATITSQRLIVLQTEEDLAHCQIMLALIDKNGQAQTTMGQIKEVKIRCLMNIVRNLDTQWAIILEDMVLNHLSEAEVLLIQIILRHMASPNLRFELNQNIKIEKQAANMRQVTNLRLILNLLHHPSKSRFWKLMIKGQLVQNCIKAYLGRKIGKVVDTTYLNFHQV